MPKNQVCLFFYVNGTFLIHGCSLDEAEDYGKFLVFPDSHLDTWDKHYARQHPVDFDYYPRGRVTYRKADRTFLIFHDRCISKEIQAFAAEHYDGLVSLELEEHYQCHSCNPYYA